MTLKSYPFSKELNFTDLDIMPIHLGNLNDRYYFAFAEGINPPSGGKAVSNDEINDLRTYGVTFKQIKQKAEEHILDVAPLWKQQNALADLYMFGLKETLDAEEQDKVNQAKNLIESIQTIRNRSNEIEESLFNGIAIDYLTDQAWGNTDA